MSQFKELTEQRAKLLNDQIADYKAMDSADDSQKDGIKTRIANRVADLSTVTEKWASEKTIKAQRDRDEADFKEMNEPANRLPQAGNGAPVQEPKTLGELFTESKGYREWTQAGHPSTNTRPMSSEFGFSLKDLPANLEQKTTMSTTAGFAPFVPRISKVVLSAQRRPVLAELIPQTTTMSSAIKYMEETTFTNNAAAVAEGGTKPEAALAYTERTVSLTKVAITLPVTDEQLEDVSQLRGLIDNRLRFMVEQQEENEILNGTGSSPRNFYGFLQISGLQTQAIGADPIATAILKAITKVAYGASFAVNNAEATGVVMHPTDFQSLITVQLGSGDQRYLFGNPGMAPTGASIKEIWGLPIIVSPLITQGTALIGDFAGMSEIFRRSAVTVDVGYINDDFTKNLQRIRCEERLALAIYRGAAFCKVTGIA